MHNMANKLVVLSTRYVGCKYDAPAPHIQASVHFVGPRLNIPYYTLPLVVPLHCKASENGWAGTKV